MAKEFTFTFTEEETNIMFEGLHELKARIANPVINKAQAQAQGQLAEAAAITPDTKQGEKA